jgi:trehalose 6-phosphate phosphatase
MIPAHAEDILAADAARSAMKLAMFLDFDGTLVGLAERPELVVVPSHLARTLERLSERLDGALALVTGRPLHAVDAFMAPALLPTAAAHGTERRAADGSLAGPPDTILAAAGQIAERLGALVRAEPRLVLEQKAGAVALHYRQAPELARSCHAAMREALGKHKEFTLVEGKMVLEARPTAIDKGVAVQRFMNEAPFSGRVPVFVGDDRTDEDGFAAVARLGGVTIKVGEGPTMASHRLANPAAVVRLVGELVESERPSERLAELLADATLERSA